MLYKEMKIVNAALMWLSSPPSMTVRACHIIIKELNKTKPAEMVKASAGILKNKLATMATIRITAPTVRKRASSFILSLERRASTDMVRKTAAVMAAAMPTIFAPSAI